MRAALADALAGRLGNAAAVIFATDAADLAQVRAAAVDHTFVLMVLVPAVPNLNRSMLLAAVGVVAVECAPRVRIAALDVATGAAVEDIVAAADFLVTAESTTGQILQIAPR